MRFLPALLLLFLASSAFAGDEPARVSVEILERVPDNRTWDLSKAVVVEKYAEPAFAFLAVPTKYSAKGHALDRSGPLVLRASAALTLPAGEYQLLVRARTAARLFLDGKIVIDQPFPKVNQSGHNPVPKTAKVLPGLPTLDPGQVDKASTIKLDGEEHEFRLEVIAGSRKTRLEFGNPVVAIAAESGPFQLLSGSASVKFSADDWPAYVAAARQRHEARDTETRLRVSAGERAYWQKRHEIARTIASEKPSPTVPDINGDGIFNDVDRFIALKLQKQGVKPQPLTSDLAFLRRVALDTTGMVPSRQMMLSFLAAKEPQRRSQIIDQLLDDPSWADHWISFWQDLLAENPGILKPVLNNSGPFRFWLYWALRDNLPMDRFATDLIMMEGSVTQGGPAAFGVATENDSPMAAKAHVLGKAFLAVDMTCARCHDAPFHPYTQQQLFGMASMLGRTSLKIPATSTVPQVAGGRKPFVKVSLAAGSQVKAAWQFAELAPFEVPAEFLRKPDDSREHLAAIVTSPRNERFARVLVNRVWQRYLGVGLVNNLDDWTESETSHPELLDYLAHQLITHNYDLKHIARLILNSHTYQRETEEKATLEKDRLFVGPAQRRMTAEQLVDSLFVAVGKEFDCEELTFDPECWQSAKNCANFGKPRRSWEFTSLSNERDRPALALPIAQGYIDLLTAFGWRDSRPDPLTARDDSLTALQSMTLANGQLMHRLIRLTDDGAVTDLCLEKQPVEKLVRALYECLLTRAPTDRELAVAVELLRDGYDGRLTDLPPAPRRETPRSASWSCHLLPDATRLQLAAEQAARTGDTPTPRLHADWRARMEDLLWSLLNSPEFIFVP